MREVDLLTWPDRIRTHNCEFISLRALDGNRLILCMQWPVVISLLSNPERLGLGDHDF